MLLNPVPLAAYVAFTGRTENYTQPRTISEPNLFELGIRKLRSRIPQSAAQLQLPRTLELSSDQLRTETPLVETLIASSGER
jgi:hypothetical protein